VKCFTAVLIKYEKVHKVLSVTTFCLTKMYI